MKYKAAIFDLDGTLVNTLKDIAESVNVNLRKLGLPEHPVDSYRLKVGNGNRMMVARSLPAEKQHLLDDLLVMQLKYYAEHFCDHSRIYSGINEMLTALKQQNLQLAVLSNKPDYLTQKLVNHLFDASTFAVIRGHLPDAILKPDPGAALAIAIRMDIEPAQFIFVGDTAMDIQTATSAGMFAVGITWGFRNRDELIAAGADCLIDQPGELTDRLLYV
ncbi:MAG: HAD-IA family hydrolase [Phycisphaerae bacterium]|nr:HAD-IA family hydrolase [Phycisphaerae bacterium]